MAIRRFFAVLGCALFLSAQALAVADAPIVYGVPSRISSLNPFLVSGIDTYELTGQIFEPLARIDGSTGSMIPWLAKSWTFEPQAKRVRVQLRPGVLFHDGSALTSADVKFTVEAFNDPQYKGEIWRAMWSGLSKVEVINDLEFFLVMKSINYQDVKNVMTALRILPRKFYAASNSSAWISQAVGTGPYRVGQFKSNRRLELIKFERWWNSNDAKWAPKRMVVKPVSDAGLAEQMLKKKELDVFEVPETTGGPLQALKIPSAFGRGFGFMINLRRFELKNPEVRLALLELWNREDLNRKVYGGEMKLAIDSFTPTSKYYPPGQARGFNPKAGGERLDKAGFLDKDQDGVRDGLVFKVLVRSHGSDRWIGLYQSDAAKMGVKVIIDRTEDEAEWWKLVKEGKFDLLAYEGPFSEAPHEPVFHSQGAYNSGGVQDAKIDRLFEQLRSEFSVEKRARANREIIIRLRELVVEIPGLMIETDRYLVSKRVRVDSKNPQDLWRWK